MTQPYPPSREAWPAGGPGGPEAPLPLPPRKALVVVVSVLITAASAAVIVFLVLWMHNVSQIAGPVGRDDLKELPGPRHVGLGVPAAPGTGGGA
ncbi:hypothetical protein [Streptomyces sp. SID3343]|uniref:hypothetical protein n=1 Tax=Streptomyces sp. SID3343 TaxID=2690260 RepID=UPI00136C9AAB|nr:hypothetical protein [Streptomyces sp. SID3343]MYW05902.1 hypothetical protein [Streptomyces sp. SID3343]